MTAPARFPTRRGPQPGMDPNPWANEKCLSPLWRPKYSGEGYEPKDAIL